MCLASYWHTLNHCWQYLFLLLYSWDFGHMSYLNETCKVQVPQLLNSLSDLSNIGHLELLPLQHSMACPANLPQKSTCHTPYISKVVPADQWLSIGCSQHSVSWCGEFSSLWTGTAVFGTSSPKKVCFPILKFCSFCCSFHVMSTTLSH